MKKRRTKPKKKSRKMTLLKRITRLERNHGYLREEFNTHKTSVWLQIEKRCDNSDDNILRAHVLELRALHKALVDHLNGVDASKMLVKNNPYMKVELEGEVK